MSTRLVGNLGEDRAVLYIQQQFGWKIIDRNLHKRFGEIDILAESKEFIILIEVKVKRSLTQGYAVEMVTPQKQRTLRKLAHFLQTEYNKPVRIDVLSIDNFASTQPIITYYPFAVGEL
jgi:putative endonuclease